MTTITAFECSPDRGQGLARDMIARWALEEVGAAYSVKPLSFKQLKEAAHRNVNPFGQIPTLEEDDNGISIFESGAVVLHIAETHAGLLPVEAATRARVISWMFAAGATMDPPIMQLSLSTLFEKEKPWFADRQTVLRENVRARLRELAAALGTKDWIEGTFSAGDLLLIAALRRLKSSGLLDEVPNVAAYVARGEARPAFHRAFAAQLAAYQAASAKA